MFVNYPNNPTGAVVPDGFFDRVVAFAREHDLLVVHDSAYSELTYDGYVAPSFLADAGSDGRRRGGVLALQGLEHDRLALRGDRRQRRCRSRAYWKLKTNVDSGLFEAVQLAGAEALTGPQDSVREMSAIYSAPARPGDRRAARDRDRHRAAEGHDLRMGAGAARATRPRRSAEEVLEQSGVVVSPGSAYGPNGEGFFRISLTVPDDRLAEAVERMRGSLG